MALFYFLNLLLLSLGAVILIAGLGFLVSFISDMARTATHMAWGVYFLSIILSGVPISVGLIIVINTFPNLLVNP